MVDHHAQRAALRRELLRAVRRHNDDCVVSHESAAVLHGLPTYAVPTRAELTRATGRRRTGRTHVHVADLAPDDVVLVDGVPVTSLARTAVDIARSQPLLPALVVADAVLRRGVSRAELEDVLRRMDAWPGVVRARRAVRCADGRAESPLESVVRGRFVLLDLPMPELQVWVEEWTRVDFWWRRHGVVGEADGMTKYVEPGVLRQEKQRQEWLEQRLVVVRWGWRQAHDHDDVFRARLQSAFVRAERLRSPGAGPTPFANRGSEPGETGRVRERS